MTGPDGVGQHATRVSTGCLTDCLNPLTLNGLQNFPQMDTVASPCPVIMSLRRVVIFSIRTM